MLRPGLPRIVALCTRIYSHVLWLCPRQYRREYGALMLQAFQDQCCDAYRQGGAAKVARTWPPALLDLWMTAGAEHLAALKTETLAGQAAGVAGVALLAVLIAAIARPAHGAAALPRESGGNLLASAAGPTGDSDLVGLVSGPASGAASRAVSGAGPTATSRPRRPATSPQAYRPERQAAIMEAQAGETTFTLFLPDGQVVHLGTNQTARIQLATNSQERLLIFR